MTTTPIPHTDGAPLDRRAWRFFFDHAGYATPPGRAVCAAALARAEAMLEEMIEAGDARVTWDHDECPDTSWMDAEQLTEYERGENRVPPLHDRDTVPRVSRLGARGLPRWGPRPDLRMVRDR